MYFPPDFGYIPNWNLSGQNEDKSDSEDDNKKEKFKQTIDNLNIQDPQSKPSNNASMLEIGYKQNIIEELKKYEKFYEEHLIQMKSFIKMSELYLDAYKQLYDFEADETFKNYIKEELEKKISCQDRIELINMCLKDVKDCQNYLKTNISIGEADKILKSITTTYNKRNESFKKNLEILKPIFIYKYLDLCNVKETEYKNKMLENQVTITVIGRRGSGKSSFINAFRNLNSFDNEAAQTDDVECTLLSKFYLFDTYEQDSVASSKQTSKIYLLDFPGVGTENFPSSDYTEMLLSMRSDAYIYLFQYTIDDLDFKILNEIRSKLKNKVPLFLVRNKIDMDFENFVCPLIGKQSLEEIPDMDALVDSHWFKMHHTLINHYEIDMKPMLNLSSNQRIYFISSDMFFKKYFDYEDLIRDLVKNMSEQKSETLFKAFKKKCNQVRGYFSLKLMKELFLDP